MERHRKAMRLVADALQQPQRRAVRIDADRQIAVADEDQLLFLRQADGDQVGQPDLLERLVRGVQLPLPAVDQDQVGKRPALLDELSIPAPDHLLHRGEVVEQSHRRAAAGRAAGDRGPVRGRRPAGQTVVRSSRRSLRGDVGSTGAEFCACRCGTRTGTLHAEFAILALLHPAVFADDHRRDRFAALNRRDVETLDAPWQRGQLQNPVQQIRARRSGRSLRCRIACDRRTRRCAAPARPCPSCRRAAARRCGPCVRRARDSHVSSTSLSFGSSGT